MERSTRSYWDRIAQRWRIAAPLAPAKEDVDWFQQQVAGHDAVRALLLGVTRSLATMRWPAGASLVAADWSLGMLKQVWLTPGAPERSAAICADWRELPFAAASFGLVIGDGCYSALAGLDDMALLNREMRRVLPAGGRVLMRCFCRPATDLSAAGLFEQLLDGRIRNLDLFRWLLAMAVHGPSRHGVDLQDVWRAWARYVPDTRAMQARMGWTEDGVVNMERWATSVMKYSFPTVEDLRRLAAPHFEVIACDIPAYEWGELFPRMILQAR
jgi:SAM-dependent methyltransferase